MSRSEIFLGPGRWITEFLLSLTELAPDQLSPELFKALSVIATLIFWFQLWKIVAAVVRRVTGFDRQRPQR
ncbi:MAG: hypothetical protein AB7E72_01605 [Lysobacterales bacterium]